MMKTTLLAIAMVLSGGIYAPEVLGQIGLILLLRTPSANLHVANDETKIRGTLLNPITTEERNSIVSPATGLIVYDTDQKCLMTNNGTKNNPNWQCASQAKDNSNSGEDTNERKHLYY